MLSLLFALAFDWNLSSLAAAPSSTAQRLRIIVPAEASASFDQALAEVTRRFNAGQGRI